MEDSNKYFNRESDLMNEESIQAYDQAIKINPNYAETYDNKGVVLEGLEKKEEVIEDYDQAIKIPCMVADLDMNLSPREFNEFSPLISQRQRKLQDESIKEPLFSHKKYLPPFQHKKIPPESVISPSQAQTFICFICLHLLDQPITLNCEHSFCLNCLKQGENTIERCPLCKTPFPGLESLRKDVALVDLIDNLAISCPSHNYDPQKTCQEKVKIKDLEKHWKACPHILLKCRCEELIVSASFLEADTKCKCPYMKCKYCSNVYQERLIDYHSDDCKRKEIKCVYCGLTYKCEDQKSHEISDCYRFCPYKDYGCDKKTKMARRELETHCYDYKPLHDYYLLKSLNPEIAESFLHNIYKLNETIPNFGQSIVLFFEHDNKTVSFSCPPYCTLGDLIPRIAAYFDLDRPECSIEMRLKSADQHAFLMKDRPLYDYGVKYGQHLEVCMVKISDDKAEAA